MPTYVYRELTTGATFELQQRITEAPLTHNPETGEPVVRVIQPAGVVFKGSGFYKTDSRTSSAGPAKSEPKPDSKSEPKTESKPEAKAAAD